MADLPNKARRVRSERGLEVSSQVVARRLEQFTDQAQTFGALRFGRRRWKR